METSEARMSLEKLADVLESAQVEGLNLESSSDTARLRALAAARRLCRRLETTKELSHRLAWQEPGHVAAIKIALDLGLIEQLNKNTSAKGVSLADLASVTNSDIELTGRVLRFLAVWGTVDETGLDTFAANDKTKGLLDPRFNSGVDVWLDISRLCFGSLPRFLKERGYDKLHEGGSEGNWAFGTQGGMDFFDWVREHPDAMSAFNNNMAAFAMGRPTWVDIYPLDRLDEATDRTDKAPLIVDVGGSLGQDMFRFHEKVPQNAGRLVVQDLPEVIEQAKKTHSDSVIDFQAHNFRTPQPVKGAKAYFLHSVLHDWPDDACVEILANLKPALRKGYSKILIAEFVIASPGATDFATSQDMTMMAITGSKERTEHMWKALFDRAGMRVVETWSTLASGGESVMEVESV